MTADLLRTLAAIAAAIGVTFLAAIAFVACLGAGKSPRPTPPERSDQ